MKFMSERDVRSNHWPLHHETPDEWRSGRLRRKAVHRAWAQWLGRLPWELFVTLTFDPKRVFPVNENRACREAAQWCEDTARLYRLHMGWVYAPERGTSGQWHAHALLIGGPRRKGEASCLPEAAGMWRARNGSIDVQRIDGVPGVTLYTTKQAAATGAIVMSDTLRRYRHLLDRDTAVSVCP
jgi:hypothetical protein